MLSLIVSLKAIIKAEGIRALSFIPLVAEGKLIGKFMTYYRDPYRFSLEEAQLAIGIDRHNAQNELLEFEARFRLMAESAPVMIWMSGADGRCQHLNAMLRAFWGVSEDEIAEFDWQKTIHPADASEIGTKMLAALSNRTSVTVRGRYLNASGQFRLL